MGTKTIAVKCRLCGVQYERKISMTASLTGAETRSDCPNPNCASKGFNPLFVEK